jgi:chemotaxis protein CheC
MENKYSDLKIDALKEFINLGTAHAAKALSKLIDRQVSIIVPSIELTPLGDIPKKLGGPETKITGLFFRISGEISGSVLLFFPQDAVSTLIDFLFLNIDRKVEVPPENQREFEISALDELGNIMVNSYVNAIAELLDSRITISVPSFASDMLGAIIDMLIIEAAASGDHALLMETTIDVPEMKLKGNFILFPDEVSLNKIFAKLGID